MEIIAGCEPLQPRGFDPMNLTCLSGTEVLHARIVMLGNSTGRVEVMNHPSLSVSAGKHPLLDGANRLTVRGLDQPQVTVAEGGGVEVRAGGCAVEFSRAAVDTSQPQWLVITLQ